MGNILQTAAQRMAQVLAWVQARLQPFINRWRLMPRNRKLIVAGGAAFVILTVSVLSYRASRGCSSRDAVMDRVALVTATLQDDAAHHRITISELADALKRINEAAAKYNSSDDPQDYCAALNSVIDETN